MLHIELQDIMNLKREPSELENSLVGLHEKVRIKQEPVCVAEEEQTTELDLYADHEIKEEMVIGPVVLQFPNVAQARCGQSIFDKLNVDVQLNKCDVCNRGFIKKHELRSHIMTHTKKKKHQCEFCNKSFTKKGNHSRHLTTHTVKKSYICDYCHKCYTSRQGCIKHLWTHTGEKPHKCDICNKGFLATGQLKYHKMTHTGEKPHKCDICSRGFLTTGQLKCFLWKYELNSHEMSHKSFDKQPYQCNICNKGFLRIHDYIHHEMIHTGERPYKCDDCEESFVLKSNLKKHLRSWSHAEKTYYVKK
ncbi:zinc finger protein 45-like [Hyposmocoma kahamanoa]|uniref:zinc finger protein 45-like n=1 Tax=Hyposmocoma kahamanoa TaxID=1477025 RepID=UPI000E6D6934|nr:zinc finger protein 45-like [Hyposmocoma kahamanoa]